MSVQPFSLRLISASFGLAFVFSLATGNSPLATALLAQQPQTYVQPAGSGLAPSVATFPNLSIASGNVFCSNTTVTYAGGQVTTLQNGINYVYFDCGTSVPKSSTSPFSGGQIPLAVVVARSGSYGTSGLLDVRPWAVTRSEPTLQNALYVSRGQTSGTPGNVGIGTTSPATPLDVAGSLGHFRISSDGAVAQFTRGDANYIQATTSGGYFDFVLNGKSTSDANAALRLVASTGEALFQAAVVAGVVSSTPTGSSETWSIDLSTGNTQQFACGTGGATVTVSNPTNLLKGELVTLIFVQNSSACTVSWSSLIHGQWTSCAAGNICVQSFVVSNHATDLYATGPVQASSGGTP